MPILSAASRSPVLGPLGQTVHECAAPRSCGVSVASAIASAGPDGKAVERVEHLGKLLDSAVANARGKGLSPENLFVKTITVNKGAMLRRSRPFARGRAGAIRKTMSIIALELGTQSQMQKSKVKNQNDGEKSKK